MSIVTYTNKRGRTYRLCMIPTKKGKHRYIFSLRVVGTAVERIPAGFEVVESVNGVVSLRRRGQILVTDEEVAILRAELARHRHLARLKVEARKNALMVFEPLGPGDDEIAILLGLPPARVAALRRHVRYDPVMRFLLVDDGPRTFEVERLCCRDSLEGEWLALHVRGPLAKLARRYLKLIGTDEFFELW